MDPIFLTPDTTVEISIRSEIIEGTNVARYTIEDGGPYKIRTATGREYAAVQQAYAKQDIGEAYALLRKFLVAGVPAEMFERLHPDVVWRVLAEVLTRSRVSEADRGK